MKNRILQTNVLLILLLMASCIASAGSKVDEPNVTVTGLGPKAAANDSPVAGDPAGGGESQGKSQRYSPNGN